MSVLTPIYKHLDDRNYHAGIYECGTLLEIELKKLYKKAKIEIESSEKLSWDDMIKRASKRLSKPFDENKLSLGSLIHFFGATSLWTPLKKVMNGNLHYINLINWKRVKYLRNKAAHPNGSNPVTREEAIEMLFYTKVFAIESNLIQGEFTLKKLNIVSESKCPECQHDISSGWNFCPECGLRTIVNCTHCEEPLDPKFNICPNCDTPRAKNRTGETADLNKLKYKAFCKAIWIDWEVTNLERDFLEEKRLEFGLNPQEADDIEQSVLPDGYQEYLNMTRMIMLDKKIDRYEQEFLYNEGKKLHIPKEVIDKFVHANKKKGSSFFKFISLNPNDIIPRIRTNDAN